MRPVVEVVVLACVFLMGVGAIIKYLLVRQDARRPWALAGLLGELNFFSFWLIDALIGGSALLGKVVAGRHFVGNHGVLTEVPGWVWVYSWIHTVSQVLTFPLILLSWFVGREAIEDAKDEVVSFRGRGAV